MLMKTPKPVGLTLASVIVLSPVIGLMGRIEPAHAGNDWFEEVRENCQRVNGGYLCRDTPSSSRKSRGRWGPVESTRSSRPDIYQNDPYKNDPYNNGRDWVREGRVYEGAVIETRTFNNDRFEVRRGDSRSLTLVVDRDIRSDTDNYVLIPEGSRIFGKLKPNDGGVRFEADYVTLSNGKNYDLDARSDTIYGGNSRSRDRISSSAATVILGTILGRGGADVGDVLRSGSIFSGSNNRRNDDYISINPKSDLDLRLTKDFKVKK